MERGRRILIPMISLLQILAAAIALAVPFICLDAEVASAQTSRVTFRAQTEGSPAATAAGKWDLSATGATLRFSAGHVVGEDTRFVAQWTSDWLDGQSEFSTEGTAIALRPAEGKARLVEQFRFRRDSRRWSQWFTVQTAFSETINTEGSSSDFLSLSRPAQRVRYQWRLSGNVEELSSLSGEFVLEIHSE